MFDASQPESDKWQQPTPTQYETGVCYSRGISNLEQVLRQIHAQHSMLVGIFSDLLNSFPASTGTEEIMPEAAQIFVSFAKLQENLEDLLQRAKRANLDLVRSNIKSE